MQGSAHQDGITIVADSPPLREPTQPVQRRCDVFTSTGARRADEPLRSAGCGAAAKTGCSDATIRRVTVVQATRDKRRDHCFDGFDRQIGELWVAAASADSNPPYTRLRLGLSQTADCPKQLRGCARS